VPARRQSIDYLLRYTVFKVERARVEAMIVERAYEVKRLEPHGLDRLLHVHAEFGYVQKHLQ
jgi:hypothetical protein